MSVDRVLIHGLELYGYHGVVPEENRLGQRFIVDVEMDASLAEAGRTDDLAKTVDYGAVLNDVRAIVEGPPMQLVETVAERIAQRVLSAYAVERVIVRVRKPDAPLRASFDYVGIEIARSRHG